MAHLRASASVLRYQRREHGFHDQPLHRQPQGAQRRCLFPRRAYWVAPRAREAYPGVPVIAGGVEASLRRLAHYDYWSDTVRGSIVLDAKADLVVYGMGERNILAIARRLATGETPRTLRDLRGITYALGASETPPRGHDLVK